MLRRETISQVGPSVVGEHAVEPLAADQSGADVAFGFVFNLVHQMVETRRALGVRNQVEGQRQHAGSLRAVAVLAVFAVEELLVERRFEIRRPELAKRAASSGLPSRFA